MHRILPHRVTWAASRAVWAILDPASSAFSAPRDAFRTPLDLVSGDSLPQLPVTRRAATHGRSPPLWLASPPAPRIVQCVASRDSRGNDRRPEPVHCPRPGLGPLARDRDAGKRSRCILLSGEVGWAHYCPGRYWARHCPISARPTDAFCGDMRHFVSGGVHGAACGLSEPSRCKGCERGVCAAGHRRRAAANACPSVGGDPDDAFNAPCFVGRARSLGSLRKGVSRDTCASLRGRTLCTRSHASLLCPIVADGAACSVLASRALIGFCPKFRLSRSSVPLFPCPFG